MSGLLLRENPDDMISILFLPLALAAYWTCLRGPLIFDAMESIKEVKAWQWSWAWYRCRYGRSVPYRVVSVVSWAADLWRVHVTGESMDRCGTCEGRATWSLHVTNIVIHCGNAFLVEQLARFCGVPPLLAGTLFLVHPFAVNTVANIGARASLLSATFGFLAILAAVSSHPYYIAPAVGLSFLAKEDGLGFAIPVLAVLLWTGQTGWAIGLWAAGLVVVLKYLPMWKDFVKRNGDEAMAPSGLPVSLPFRDHGYTVAVETLIRLPLWFAGLGMSPYHGSGMRVPGFWRLMGAMAILLAISQLPILAGILILTGPWLVYLVCPVPDQLMEYRNYSQIAGFALMLALLPFAWFLIPVFFGMTALKAWVWRSRIEMWKESADHASGDRSRALQEVGAWLKMEGKCWEAEPYLRDAVRLNPFLAPAWDNLAFVELETGRTEQGIATLEHCTVACPKYPLAHEELGSIYQQQGKLEEAEKCYQRAHALGPAAHLENRIGLIRFYMKQYDVAFHWFKKALERTGAYMYAWNCGMALKCAGDLEGARGYEVRLKAILNGGTILGTHEMIRPDYKEAS